MEKFDLILWILSGGFLVMLVMWYCLNKRMERPDKKIDGLEKDVRQNIDWTERDLQKKIERIEKNLQQLNTKVAVMESKIAGIGSNLSHFMWHQRKNTSITRDKSH